MDHSSVSEPFRGEASVSLLEAKLDKITRAPLKPQQRMTLLRCVFIVRCYHQSVSAGATLGKLRAQDRRVQAVIRRWLGLPVDTAMTYVYTSCVGGDIGVIFFTTTVPGLVFSRLMSLERCLCPAMQVVQSDWVAKRLEWAGTRGGPLQFCRW